MAEIVYVLCALTSLSCALMLLRGYRRNRTRLLFWSCACFFVLALSNLLLFVDLVLLSTTIDLQIVRNSITLAGLAMLLYGMIWDTI
ncbi:MAG: DUF5985 family protein [Verrucomicrobiales bacterium]|nr:DUF5985 family protein [Verrucomicrobiales bacterium]